MRAGYKVVGAKGFEPSTSWSRTRRASQAALRPDRTCSAPQRLERNQNINKTPQPETSFEAPRTLRRRISETYTACPRYRKMPPEIFLSDGRFPRFGYALE